MSSISTSFGVGLNYDHMTITAIKPLLLKPTPNDVDILDILLGGYDILPGNQPMEISEDFVQNLANQRHILSKTRRYLAVLDSYCYDGRNVFFGLHRAFPVQR